MSKAAVVFTFFCIFVFMASVDVWAKDDISPGEPIKNEVPVMAALEIPEAPIPMRAVGKIDLLYEMHISNLGRGLLFLEQIQVTGGDESNKIYATYRGKDFDDMLGGFGPQPEGSDIRRILPGMRVVAYIWVSVPNKNAVPDQLHHRLYFKDGKPGENLLFLQGPTVTVNKRKVPEILSPVIGNGWLAAEGPINIRDYSHHRFGIITMGGTPRVPQRYAIDWMKFGPDGKLFKGDPKKNRSWYCYGKKIHSVADGLVKEVKDGIAENVPLEKKRAVPLTLDTICGNYVLIENGSDRYSLYAHMIPGSVRVKVGDRVAAGQVLGLLGNSGNSDAPHLHFQLDTKPAGHVLASEGLPFANRSFTYLGRIPIPFQNIQSIADVIWDKKAGENAAERKNEIPLAYRIYTFTR